MDALTAKLLGLTHRNQGPSTLSKPATLTGIQAQSCQERVRATLGVNLLQTTAGTTEYSRAMFAWLNEQKTALINSRQENTVNFQGNQDALKGYRSALSNLNTLIKLCIETNSQQGNLNVARFTNLLHCYRTNLGRCESVIKKQREVISKTLTIPLGNFDIQAELGIPNAANAEVLPFTVSNSALITAEQQPVVANDNTPPVLLRRRRLTLLRVANGYETMASMEDDGHATPSKAYPGTAHGSIPYHTATSITLSPTGSSVAPQPDPKKGKNVFNLFPSGPDQSEPPVPANDPDPDEPNTKDLGVLAANNNTPAITRAGSAALIRVANGPISGYEIRAHMDDEVGGYASASEPNFPPTHDDIPHLTGSSASSSPPSTAPAPKGGTNSSADTHLFLLKNSPVPANDPDPRDLDLEIPDDHLLIDPGYIPSLSKTTKPLGEFLLEVPSAGPCFEVSPSADASAQPLPNDVFSLQGLAPIQDCDVFLALNRNPSPAYAGYLQGLVPYAQNFPGLNAAARMIAAEIDVNRLTPEQARAIIEIETTLIPHWQSIATKFLELEVIPPEKQCTRDVAKMFLEKYNQNPSWKQASITRAFLDMEQLLQEATSPQGSAAPENFFDHFEPEVAPLGPVNTLWQNIAISFLQVPAMPGLESAEKARLDVIARYFASSDRSEDDCSPELLEKAADDLLTIEALLAKHWADVAKRFLAIPPTGPALADGFDIQRVIAKQILEENQAPVSASQEPLWQKPRALEALIKMQATINQERLRTLPARCQRVAEDFLQQSSADEPSLQMLRSHAQSFLTAVKHNPEGLSLLCENEPMAGSLANMEAWLNEPSQNRVCQDFLSIPLSATHGIKNYTKLRQTAQGFLQAAAQNACFTANMAEAENLQLDDYLQTMSSFLLSYRLDVVTNFLALPVEKINCLARGEALQEKAKTLKQVFEERPELVSTMGSKSQGSLTELIAEMQRILMHPIAQTTPSSVAIGKIHSSSPALAEPEPERPSVLAGVTQRHQPDPPPLSEKVTGGIRRRLKQLALWLWNN